LLSALYFRDIWGCLLTPKNVSDLVDTSGVRYHVWVATKKVVDTFPLAFGCLSLWRVPQRSYDRHALRKFYVRRVLRQFVGETSTLHEGSLMVFQLFELGLAMLGAVKGSVLIFVDSRLHNSKVDMVYEARALVDLFDRANVRRWRVVITVMYSQLCTQPFFDRPQLPATDDGIRAAHILTSVYSIGVHLSMVTSLAHACACIEAGAIMLSMNVAPVSTPSHVIKPSLKVGSAIRSLHGSRRKMETKSNTQLIPATLASKRFNHASITSAKTV
jgi:transaldolase